MPYFPAQSAAFEKLLKSLAGKRVAVIGHMRPDGDCIGSQVAFCRIARAAGIDAICVNHHAVPAYLKPFVADTPFVHENDFRHDGHEAVCTDCADLTRIGKQLAAQFPKIAGNIDHHISNDNFAETNIVLPDTAAACHMLAAFVFDLEIKIDAATARALYAGIVTDTGQFRFPSTTPEVFEIAARLLRLGASPQFTTSNLYEHDRFGRLELLRRFLSSLELHAGGRICSGDIPLGSFEATGTSKEDTEGFVDYPRCVDGVDIAVLFEEMTDGIKGSLRAKDPKYRLDLLGKKLNGGGHTLAAGFNFPKIGLAENKAEIIAIIEEHLSSIP